MATEADMLIIAEEKPKAVTFAKPDGLEFETPEKAKEGQYFMCKICQKGDRLYMKEIEGIPLPGYAEEEESEYVDVPESFGDAIMGLVDVDDGEDDD